MPFNEDKIFFFKGSKKRLLLGFLHTTSFITNNTGIVYCHPFADEQALSQRVVINTCRAIAKLGFPVLRFDMSGCGDSEGKLDEVTISDWQEDLMAAINVLKRETGVRKFALWGLRLGASLSLLYDSQFKDDASFIILWQPVLNFSLYIKQFLRRKVAIELADGGNKKISISTILNEINDYGIVDALGYPITKNLYENFVEIGNHHFHCYPTCKTFLLTVSLMEYPSSSIERYTKALQSNETPLQFLHLVSEPFWDRYWRWECPEVTNATLKWLNML